MFWQYSYQEVWKSYIYSDSLVFGWFCFLNIIIPALYNQSQFP